MLAVGVDAAGERVAPRLGVRVAGGDPLPQSPVLAEREDLGAVRTRDGGGPVGGAVVDDEDVRLGEPRSQLVEDGGKVRPPRSRPG